MNMRINKRKEIDALEAKTKALEDANQDLEAKTKALEDANQDLEAKIKILETANQDLEAKAKALEAENQDLKVTNQTLETAIQLMKDEHAQEMLAVNEEISRQKTQFENQVAETKQREFENAMKSNRRLVSEVKAKYAKLFPKRIFDAESLCENDETRTTYYSFSYLKESVDNELAKNELMLHELGTSIDTADILRFVYRANFEDYMYRYRDMYEFKYRNMYDTPTKLLGYANNRLSSLSYRINAKRHEMVESYVKRILEIVEFVIEIDLDSIRSVLESLKSPGHNVVETVDKLLKVYDYTCKKINMIKTLSDTISRF